MSAEELLKLTEKISSAVTDTQAIRGKIFEEFDAATTSDQRVALLVMLKATMDTAESWIAKNGTEKELAEFREARAQDYDKLLVKESTVNGTLKGTVVPHVLMAVTNREIAAGRITPADSIRQVAVNLAASIPQPSHVELLEQAEAKKRADVLIDRLLHELKTPGGLDLPKVRESIGKAFDASATSEQRGKVLSIFKATMDDVERHLAGRGDQVEALKNFREARAQEYKLFIAQECIVGLDTPVVGGDFSVDMLMAVTNREIAAGRMTEDHSTRQMAVKCAAAPHLSHAELIAKHAKLKDQAARSKREAATSTPDEAPGSAKSAYAFGVTLGRTLKGFFRK